MSLPTIPMPGPLRPLLWSVCLAGAVVTGVAIAVAPSDGWAGLLVAAVWGVTVCVGAALFAAIKIVSGARWWWPIRGVCMGIAGTFPVPAAALAVLLVGGVTVLYPWAHDGAAAHSHLIHEKAAWLNVPFFLARGGIVLLVWLGFILALRRHLAAPAPGRALPRLAAGFIVVFGVTISVAFWDWTMSLEPEWFSTMYGVYGFAGALQAGIAAILLGALWTERRRAGHAPTTVHQRKTLGSLLFAFSFFWAYIWYCQAMLIWYANLPEEVVHYNHRLENAWNLLFWLNPVLNFAIPFAALLSSRARSSTLVLGHVALLVLVGHFVDLLLLVGPASWHFDGVMPYVAAAASLSVAAGMLVFLYRRPRRIALPAAPTQAQHAPGPRSPAATR